MTQALPYQEAGVELQASFLLAFFAQGHHLPQKMYSSRGLILDERDKYQAFAAVFLVDEKSDEKSGGFSTLADQFPAKKAEII
ncbi:hypothetical protein EPA93_25405 [Ktedonosporobacter rubrisoli]|uniref:Uncharacterized protein n=1 Tax=Ktedonosporobacter rubrisoli TaxID=2509675 RepID=A0A4P6JUT6_KTERU|nr:hypothetical protein [Ktedonosporobacter rubrisoli]QBD79135.1 hypothetical protein EPA93_25405 [Ktedonosporobacter rubrisoli]